MWLLRWRAVRHRRRKVGEQGARSGVAGRRSTALASPGEVALQGAAWVCFILTPLRNLGSEWVGTNCVGSVASLLAYVLFFFLMWAASILAVRFYLNLSTDSKRQFSGLCCWDWNAVWAKQFSEGLKHRWQKSVLSAQRSKSFQSCFFFFFFPVFFLHLSSALDIGKNRLW